MCSNQKQSDNLEKKITAIQKADLAELVNNAQTNADNGESFSEICRRFTGLVKKYAYQSHLASIREDALSEGWLALAEAVKTYNQARQVNIAGYIESRVKYAIWNLFKKEKKKWQREVLAIIGEKDEEIDILTIIPVDNPENDPFFQVASKMETSQKLDELQKAMLSLAPKQKLAIKRTLVDRLSLKQTAQEMGITVQAVFNLQKRGLNRLKRNLPGMF